MAKTEATAIEAPVAEIPLSLNEFCSRLSARVTQPELIAGFEHTERLASRMNDIESAYAKRFNDFGNKPV